MYVLKQTSGMNETAFHSHVLQRRCCPERGAYALPCNQEECQGFTAAPQPEGQTPLFLVHMPW